MKKHRHILVIFFTLHFAIAPTGYAETISAAQFDKWMQSASNWGRWGKEDQLGTLNLITPSVRKTAASYVRDGISVSLARTLDKTASIDNPAPFNHTMLGVGTPVDSGGELIEGYGADRFSVAFHGFAHTHLDALGHVFYDGRMYNGLPQTDVSPNGASSLSVLNLKDGVFTRGVLVDFAAQSNVDYLDVSERIGVKAFEDWEARTGVRIRSGDAVLIRTGRWARRAHKGPWDVMQGAAGVTPEVALWLKERDVAIVGSDNGPEALPSRVEGQAFPFHSLAIVAMGMPLLDSLDLETLSRELSERKRWTFLLVVAPLPVDGGTGSPINPIATF